jgi:hypothetical protein
VEVDLETWHPFSNFNFAQDKKILVLDQGDQIARIFASWAICLLWAVI